MTLSQHLLNKNFTLSATANADLQDYIAVKKHCYEKYVDEYYGDWVDDVAIEINTKAFNKMIAATCFQKILLFDKAVGFWGFDELSDTIDSVTIQLITEVQGQGLGSCYLEQLVELSTRTNKSTLLKVFKSNPARKLYERFGFKVYDETVSHYLMRYISR